MFNVNSATFQLYHGENKLININRTKSFKCKTYLSCLMDAFFNKRLVFQWVRIVLRYSPICFDMLLRHTSYIKLTQTFNSSCHYIDDVLSRNKFWFGDYIHRIYPNELEMRDITDAQRHASYLDIHLEIDNCGILKTKLYEKCDDFTFPIVNFLFIGSNI